MHSCQSSEAFEGILIFLQSVYINLLTTSLFGCLNNYMPAKKKVTTRVRNVSNKNVSTVVGIIVLLVVGIPLTLLLVFTQTQWFNHASGPALTLDGYTNLNSSSVNLTAQNNDGTMGPAYANGNWSNALPYSQRGNLVFAVIDPMRGGKPSDVPSHNARPTDSYHTNASDNADTARGENASGSGSQNHGPQDVSSLKLTISKVEVHLANLATTKPDVSPEAEAGKPTTTPEAEAAGQPVSHWETLDLNVPTTLDLVELAKTHDLSTLGLTSLAAGHYTEVRLYVSSAAATLSDGTPVDLKILGHDNVVRVVQSFSIAAGGTTKLTMDFDAGHSVIKAGDSYLLKPVVARLLTSSEAE